MWLYYLGCVVQSLNDDDDDENARSAGRVVRCSSAFQCAARMHAPSVAHHQRAVRILGPLVARWPSSRRSVLLRYTNVYKTTSL